MKLEKIDGFMVNIRHHHVSRGQYCTNVSICDQQSIPFIKTLPNMSELAVKCN